jgi:hypothetical protein
MSTKKKLRRMELAKLKMEARTGGQPVAPSRLSGSLAGGIINSRRASAAAEAGRAAQRENVREWLIAQQHLSHQAIAARLGVPDVLVHSVCAQVSDESRSACPHPRG